MSKNIIVIMVVVILGASIYLLKDEFLETPQPQTRPPKVLERRNTSEPINPENINPLPTGILDFNEVLQFNSIEEIGEIRFTMTVGKVYGRYSYHGIVIQDGQTLGAIHITDTSDPEYTTESKFGVQVGNSPTLGFSVGDDYIRYTVRVLEVTSTTLKLRIEEIW